MVLLILKSTYKTSEAFRTHNTKKMMLCVKFSSQPFMDIQGCGIITLNPTLSLTFMISVARERRRGDRPPTNVWGDIYIWSMWGDKEFFVS